MKRIIRAAKVSVAPAVVAVAVLAACGGGDPGQATSQAGRRQVESLAPSGVQAEHYERLAHLRGQARTYGAPTESQDVVGTDSNWGLAESLERSAKLEGQARTYSKANSTDDASAPADDEFVPGSRHMPVR